MIAAATGRQSGRRPSGDGAAMPDALSRAKRYRENAAECLQLAGLAADQAIVDEYRRIAEHYIKLAEAEEKLAAQWAARLNARRSCGWNKFHRAV